MTSAATTDLSELGPGSEHPGEEAVVFLVVVTALVARLAYDQWWS